MPGESREYHSLSRGWIVNEVVRRSDPAGRTIGQVLLEDYATPLARLLVNRRTCAYQIV